jgi:spore germination protein
MHVMFRFFKKRILQQMTHEVNQKKQNHENPNQIFPTLMENIEQIKRLLHSPNDLIIRIVTIGNSNHRCAIVYIDGLVDNDIVNTQILNNIQLGMAQANKEIPANDKELLIELENEILSIGELKKVQTLDAVMFAVLSGETAIFVEGTTDVLLIGTKGWASRGIEEPVSEALVRGPREGFTEDVRTNTVLIRRHIRDPNLRFENFQVGRRSKKDLFLVYIDGIVHPEIVKEVKKRLDSIDMDDAPESGFIEQWIEDSFMSPFPQILHTERPDKACASILEGKVVIILDGTPFVLIAPVTFVALIQSPEDYYERWMIGSLIRILRYVAAFISLFLPALYIALVSFHQGMIPSKLAFSIAASREGVPFPAVVEAFMMEITLELLREAGLRLPKPVGQTIGIVGGLVIGESAVQAGIVSPVMVIVVSVTAISSFAVPSYSAGIAFRMLRFLTMLTSSIFGLYGIILTYIMINVHLARLKSFGIPYTAPFSPNFKHDLKDLVIRAPLIMLSRRPQFMQTEDDNRMDTKEE